MDATYGESELAKAVDGRPFVRLGASTTYGQHYLGPTLLRANTTYGRYCLQISLGDGTVGTTRSVESWANFG